MQTDHVTILTDHVPRLMNHVTMCSVSVGNIDGYLKGRRYFQCPPGHGVMVTASDIICVTGRKVCVCE